MRVDQLSYAPRETQIAHTSREAGIDFWTRQTAPPPVPVDRTGRKNEQQAQGLLRVLDALIDLGDRRSAALEQTEAFRNIQRSDKDVASVRRLK